jgi:hypothetical protein
MSQETRPGHGRCPSSPDAAGADSTPPRPPASRSVPDNRPAGYRGLEKNAHRLFVTCALANRFIAGRHLLRRQGA